MSLQFISNSANSKYWVTCYGGIHIYMTNA
jgi:hypothetical protein